MSRSRFTLNQLLIYWGVGVMLLLFLPFWIYLIISIQHFFERNIEENAGNLARITATQVVEPLLVGDRLSLLNNLEKITAIDKNISYVCIENTDGEIISHTFKDGFPAGLKEFWRKNPALLVEFRSDSGTFMDISAPIMSGQLGVLHIGYSKKYLTHNSLKLILILSFGMITALVIVSAGAWFVSSRVSRPLLVLEKEAVNFNPRVLPEKISGLKGTREVDSLIRGFGEMFHRLNALENERVITQSKLIHHERLSALGEMAAGLAHEIRNPLDGMLECIRYLDADPGNIGRQVKYLPMIHDGLKRINEVIQNMLMFARLGNISDSEVCPTADIIDTLELMLHGKLKANNIKLTWHKPGLCRCLANKQAIIQTLLNMVLNAVDALKDKNVPEIVIEATCDKNWVYLSVEDNGNGIIPGNEEKIFEPFFTTKPPGRGTGLGLSISRQLIRAAGGDLLLSSKPSVLGGARFEIKIPRVYQKENCCV